MITPSEPAMTERSVPQPAETADDFILWPVQGTINSGFGPRGASLHDGIDIAAPEGTPIQAVERGEVIYSDQLRGYGNIVIIRHAGGLVSVYAHNQVNLVREGSMVERGDVIAKVGSTGRVTGPHLHFEIRKHNAAQDPVRYLPQLCCAPASDNVTPNG
jgi:murein DD-endopeptidase MepM/ murein hydrolase activator NlpD